MGPSKATEIVPGIFRVGAVDWQRRIFDSLISLPYGPSYNAYPVVGKDKIDHMVINHAEPDHAGSIPRSWE